MTVTGSEGVPKVELFNSDEGLIFGLTPATPDTEAQSQETPEPQAQQPESETEPPQTSVEDESIDVFSDG